MLFGDMWDTQSDKKESKIETRQTDNFNIKFDDFWRDWGRQTMVLNQQPRGECKLTPKLFESELGIEQVRFGGRKGSKIETLEGQIGTKNR